MVEVFSLYKRMILQLQDLPKSGWQWSGDVPRSLLEDATLGTVDALSGLCSDAHWNVELHREGGCYRLSGEWHLCMWRHCRRCNADFEHKLSGQSQRDYSIGDDASVQDEQEVLPPPGRLDLLDVLREDIWLARPGTVVCSAECKGLCPKCGQDLNAGGCGCTTDDSDHPFAKLKQLKLN